MTYRALCAGVDLIDYIVSVPSDGAKQSPAPRVSFSHRAERRYSEFASFAAAINQLRSTVVRAQRLSAGPTATLAGTPMYRTACVLVDLTQPVTGLQVYMTAPDLCKALDSLPAFPPKSKLVQTQEQVAYRRNALQLWLQAMFVPARPSSCPRCPADRRQFSCDDAWLGERGVSAWIC